MSSRRILLIHRDALIVSSPGETASLRTLRLMPDVIPSLAALRDAGNTFVMLTQQADEVQDFLLALFASQGVPFEEVFVHPRLPDPSSFDRSRSHVIGNRDADMALARTLDIDGIRVASETWPQLARRLAAATRTAVVSRKTKETDINVEVRLDEEGPIRIATGIGFFDHMLEQVAKHGGFSLQLACSGDLHIDEHHTVEDCALALGQALKTALGDKRGIHRYGFLLPMDEALAQVAIDLSGRPYFVFEGAFGRDQVGQLPTELVPHFFRSLAETLGAAINIRVSGDNTHHMIEACFKGVGRTLRQAIRITDTQLPSTKGTL
ncbi:MAG TPA: imidazoleglycerol-phosphate dehydratase HisB [Steroidobacteraceae bacterium]|nr:imidazoleglycerol-phosphate dehydratase HisB [Steroidobacteraceae bacterium]